MVTYLAPDYVAIFLSVICMMYPEENVIEFDLFLMFGEWLLIVINV